MISQSDIPAQTQTQVSYGELDDCSNQGAQLFRKLGLGPGDGIAVWLPNCAEYLKITWAAQRAGLYYTPISTYFKAEEVLYILENSDAKLLITNQALLAALPEEAFESAPRLTVAPQLITMMVDDTNTQGAATASQARKQQSNSPSSQSLLSWQTLRDQQPKQPIEDESEGAEMFYSSGTTGRPKGVRFPLKQAPFGTPSKMFTTRVSMHQIDAHTRYLSTAPMYHSAPLRYNMIVTRSGGTAYILEKFDAELALSTIESFAVTHSQWVPTMFVRLLKLPKAVRQTYNTTSLKFVIHAAAPCPIQIKQQMIDWLGPVIYEYYSGTEANGFTAITSQEWLEHQGSVGKSIQGDIHILDDNGRAVPTGATGGVYFANSPDFSYHKDPVKTAAAKTKDGLSTLGDIGYLDAEGYLYLKDRKSFMIISGGVNIYPQEIEDLLISHPMIKDVAVFGVPNDEFGEEVKAVVEPAQPVLNESARTQFAAELNDYCRSKLSPIKCPKSFDFMSALPRHPTGKLYKEQLKQAYWP